MKKTAPQSPHNPVAKHAHRFNRCARHADKRRARHEKHRQMARQTDISGLFCCPGRPVAAVA
ncbi:MAG: DUF7230 family protein [Pseudomonadota bacterium]